MKAYTLFLVAFITLGSTAPSGAVPMAENVSITGFVDAAYYSNDTEETSSFSLDQAEIDIEKNAGHAGLRLDINYVNGQEATADNVLEQGYVWVSLPGAARLTFGKFNAPIGFELLDPADMYQYSHAMVFDYGLPTNLTGAMLSGGLGAVDVALYVVNGWDLISDDNKDKTFGGRFGITPLEGVNAGISYITGKEGADDARRLTVLDADLTVTMLENLTLGFEYNYGVYEGASSVNPGEDAKFSGWLAMANYAFTDKIALTMRYDSFDDEDGSRLGSGVSEKRDSITISPSYAIADGFGVLAEWRRTKSGKPVFAKADGGTVDVVTEIAVEFTYVF